MNFQKDNNKESKPSAFLGSFPQSVQTYSHLMTSQSERLPISVRKIERLSAAIYLITNHLADTEPIKDKLRLKGLDLLSTGFFGSRLSFNDRQQFTKQSHDTILEIVALFNIAVTVGLISPMNFKVVTEECGKLISQIESFKKGAADFILSTEFFSSATDSGEQSNNVVVDRVVPVEGAANNETFLEGQTDNKPPSPISGIPKINVSDRLNPDISVSKGQSHGIKSSVVHKSNQQNDYNRRDSVLEALRKSSQPLSIKDFTKIITGCSEKTIQRELAALVSDRVVVKEGERRWSTYRLRN